MDNREYVIEKLAMNYAGLRGRILARLGNKNAKKVIDQFKESYGKALDLGYTKSFGSFIKDMERNPAVAKDFVQGQNEAIQAAEAAKNVVAKEGETAGKQWAIFKPWSRKAKILAASGLAVGGGVGAGMYIHNKGQMQQPTEEELYQMQMQGQ